MPDTDRRPVYHKWYRPDIYQGYGITYVNQSRESCWTGVVSMLTGIDYDILPVAPLATAHLVYNERSGRLCATRDLRTKARRNGLFTHGRYRTDYNNVATVGQWAKLLRANGFRLTVTKNPPKDIPVGQLVGQGDHVVVRLPDGQVLDPNGGELRDYVYSARTYERIGRGLTDTFFVIRPI